jgi:hypothetical protein
MNPTLHLKIAGALMLLLAAAHVYFPKRFGWKEDLRRLSPLNRQIFVSHCLFIVLVLVLFGSLSIFCAESLVQPDPLARAALSGLVFFWAARLFVQLFVYDSILWKGNSFNTAMHVLCCSMWSYYVAVYANALWHQYH